jgi:glycosyltransferase involved in cell wall biosynthesis
MGKAVICTETTGQVGVLEPGVNCLQVPPSDPGALRGAICELWNDPAKCARFGAAGRKLVVARHGVDQWIDGLVRAVKDASAARRAADELRLVHSWGGSGRRSVAAATVVARRRSQQSGQ